jgi:Ca2+-binding RTX toxin-like protein
MLKTLGLCLGATALAAGAGVAAAGSASANDDNGHPWYPRCAHELDDFNYIAGSLDGDFLVGTDDSDWIRGRAGNDVIIGKDCNDVLSGNGGNDRIRAVDNYRDSVNGGRGTDRCVGDVFDTFTSCEVVVIRSPFPG